MSTLIPDYEHWQYTPVIPKLYWDAYSAEERIKRICLTLDKMRAYINNTTDAFNTLSDDLRAQMNDLRARMDAIEKTADGLHDALDKLVANLPVYDPTLGRYVSSQIANRNMYRELAVFGARVSQMALLKVPQAASVSCLEMAVIGNYSIFGNHEPRVTTITENSDVPPDLPETPSEDGRLSVRRLANGVVVDSYFRDGSEDKNKEQ